MKFFASSNNQESFRKSPLTMGLAGGTAGSAMGCFVGALLYMGDVIPGWGYALTIAGAAFAFGATGATVQACQNADSTTRQQRQQQQQQPDDEEALLPDRSANRSPSPTRL